MIRATILMVMEDEPVDRRDVTVLADHIRRAMADEGYEVKLILGVSRQQAEDHDALRKDIEDMTECYVNWRSSGEPH